MTAIWQHDGSNWHLLVPRGFPNEATLHALVEQAPHLLPLASTPRLIVLGKEVQLGNGYADLIAIEPSGRLVIIEIKLLWSKTFCTSIFEEEGTRHLHK
jgi:RecB family endonuclease NucS